MRTTAQILRDYKGPALFSFGFRPFFLLAGIWGALAVPLWVLPWLGWAPEGLDAIFSRDWHVHEMLFGYTGAVITGYMIVAGANWTGHYPVAGRPVMALVGLWLAGRVAMLLAPAVSPMAEVVEAVFLPLFALILWREQLAARNWRSLPPCLVITLLALADIGFHLRGASPALGLGTERAAIALITFLIALMGGRLVPSFTRNWFARHRIRPEPAPQSRFDQVVLALTGVGLALWVLAPDWWPAGVLLIGGGFGLLIRLLRWRGWVAAREGMVLILHLGYLWCGLGVGLLGAAILWPALVPYSLAVHALTAGAIGVMTLAVMTRTARSHTGRDRHADAPVLVIYALANLAALLRVLAPLLAGAYFGIVGLSALAWALGFGLFAVTHALILMRPMQRKKRPNRPRAT